MTSKIDSGRGGRHDPTMTSRSKASRRFGVEPASIKALRAQTGLSQAKFAELLSVDLGTLRNWEQGRREPTGPAKALLRAIHRDPANVLKALAG